MMMMVRRMTAVMVPVIMLIAGMATFVTMVTTTPMMARLVVMALPVFLAVIDAAIRIAVNGAVMVAIVLSISVCGGSGQRDQTYSEAH